jgi:hypothetical protein
MPLEHDLVMALNDELLRIEAREKAHDRWFGPGKELLERLPTVPSVGGAEGVRSEFS